MTTELIIIKELYKSTRIEPSFIALLHDEGLIEIQIVEGEEYINETQLADLERFARWYYDLSINIEGIDVIRNLLGKMNEMESELNSLRKLMDYHKRQWD